MHKEIQKLITYRVEQALETINEVEIQIENNFFSTAINRIYYGMFYLLLALSLKNNFKTSKHNQLIGWFNKEFIKTGKVEKKFGRIIHKAFEDRSDGDYGIYITFEKEEVLQRFEEMKEFISQIKKLI
ncbi:MAG: HEPN domain-containing protein [Bacteroidales bacterium]|nr:HEPN domain-containing protein [Bacteroidales bacterium]